MHRKRCRQAGFTLIELAVVLVIVGILVAGIMVGRELVANAEVRAQIKQITNYNEAINAFSFKYNGLPGDIAAAKAAAYGFKARSGATGHGDGDGVLEHCETDPTDAEVPLECEIVLLWADLSSANLIEGRFTDAVDGDYEFDTFEESLAYFPQAKISDAANIVPATARAYEELWLVVIGLASHNNVGDSLAPRVAAPLGFAMDSKMDDGSPMAGSVLAREADAAANPTAGYFFADPTQGANACVNASRYNFNATSYCQINFRVQK